MHQNKSSKNKYFEFKDKWEGLREKSSLTVGVEAGLGSEVDRQMQQSETANDGMSCWAAELMQL